jgi:hypothetical protein
LHVIATVYKQTQLRVERLGLKSITLQNSTLKSVAVTHKVLEEKEVNTESFTLPIFLDTGGRKAQTFLNIEKVNL